VSVRKVEQWRVSWREGRRPRSRKFGKKALAEMLARKLEREHGREGVRKMDQWEVRWREGGRDSRRRQRTFDCKRDAETFDREVKRRKQLGELATWEKRNHTVRELGREWWANYAVPNLAEWTLTGYEPILAKHIERRLGGLRVGEVSPEVVADFRRRLEAAGVGRHSVRLSLVVLQAMFKQAVAWGWVQTNPVKAVAKPSGKRERAVVCLAPSQVEAVRAVLLAKEKLSAATLVSLVAYQGLRVPEEVLALEVKHVRAKSSATSPARSSRVRRCAASTRGRSTGSSPRGATSPSTCSRWDFAAGRSFRGATASRGSCTTTRTGAGGSGTPPSTRPRPSPPRRLRKARPQGFLRTTSDTRLPRCRSGLDCRSPSWPSRWVTRR
jgi:hypothetical protein